METEIQNALSSILNVDGITGAMAIKNDKSILGALMPNLYTEDNLNELCELTINTYSTMKEIKIRPDEMVFDYNGMQLFIKDLRGKGLLMVMNESDVSPSFLNIATNMARKKLVNHLNNKLKKLKSISSTTQAISSSTNSMYKYQSQNKPEFSSADFDMTDEMKIFNILLHSLYQVNKTEFPGSEDQFLEKVTNTASQISENPILIAQFNDWSKAKAEMPIATHLTKSQMHQIIHPLYVFLCEYHGPIEGEMLMNKAIAKCSEAPESKRFSPRNLL